MFIILLLLTKAIVALKEYLNLCIDTAREVWDNEHYIFFDSALYRFQFHRKKLVCLMSLKNEGYKEQLVEGYYEEKDNFCFAL